MFQDILEYLLPQDSGIIRNELNIEQIKIGSLFFYLLDLANLLEINELNGSVYKLIKSFLDLDPNLGRKGIMSEVLKTRFSGLIMQAQNSISNSSFIENLEEINAELEKENNHFVSNDTSNLIDSTIYMDRKK